MKQENFKIFAEYGLKDKCLAIYHERYNSLPNIIEICCNSMLKEEIFEIFKKHDFLLQNEIEYSYYTSSNDNDLIIYDDSYEDNCLSNKKNDSKTTLSFSNYIYSSDTKNIIIGLNEERDKIIQIFIYLDRCYAIKTIENLKKDLDEYVLAKKELEDKEERINIVVRGQNGFDVHSNRAVKENIHFDLSYNFSKKEFEEELSSEGPGLILLTGEPGTGKTSLIYNIPYMNCGKKVFIMNNDMLDVLTDPGVFSFAIKKLKNSILVFEDNEHALLNRKTHPNSKVGGLLNLTDGIFGRLLNSKIIITLNTKENIDPALLRKGRLQKEFLFEKLSAENATELSERIGKNTQYTNPIKISDVYNTEENNSSYGKPSKIGF